MLRIVIKILGFTNCTRGVRKKDNDAAANAVSFLAFPLHDYYKWVMDFAIGRFGRMNALQGPKFVWQACEISLIVKQSDGFSHFHKLVSIMPNICTIFAVLSTRVVNSQSAAVAAAEKKRKMLPLGRKQMDGICYATCKGQAIVFKICLLPLLVVKTISKPSYRQTWKSIRPRQTRWTSFTLVGEFQMKLLLLP